MNGIQKLQITALILLVFHCLAAGAADPLDQWHQIETTGSVPNRIIRYGQGKWLGLGWTRSSETQYLHASTDGRNWVISRICERGEEPVDLAFAAGLWVLAGRYQSTNLFVLTSTNGQAWTAATIPPVASLGHWPQVQRHKDEWIITSATHILRSADGSTWNWSLIGNAPGNFFYLNGYWVAQISASVPGNYRGLAASTNLIDWHWWRPWPFEEGREFLTLKFAHGLWYGVVVHQDLQVDCLTSIVTSIDGTNWITRQLARQFTDLELVNGRLIATSSYFSWIDGWQSGPIFESDPLIWLQQGSPGNLTVHRASGIPVVVEASDNLHQWTTLTNLPLGNAIEALTEPAPSGPKRFYRARTP